MVATEPDWDNHCDMNASVASGFASRNTPDVHAMTLSPEPSLLWIGDAKHRELNDVITALRSAAPVVECRTMCTALELDGTDDCALIVVGETFPGEHLRADYESLRRRRPATPLVRVYGSLCEGELRTNPPTAAIRLPWLRAARELTNDWRRLLRGECPSWGRPAASTDDEQLLLDLPTGSAEPITLESVGLAVRDPATAAWLHDLLQRRGIRPVRVDLAFAPSAETPTSAVIWDQPLDAATTQSELTLLRRHYSQAPLIVLAGFPRIDVVQQLRAAGATAVLAKPLAVDELEAALHAL